VREVSIRVAAGAVEEVLDRLLPIAPDGVRERDDGEVVTLILRGPRVPATAVLKRAAGTALLALSEGVASDDWRERRRADLRPVRIAGGLTLLSGWAAESAAAADTGLTIVLADESAFGTGTHPTTAACLELLLELDIRGSFADLGCGTGVLAILAATLGFEPVLAVDRQPSSVDAARSNARRNGVAIAVRQGEIDVGPERSCDVIAANVPPAVHRALVAGLAAPAQPDGAGNPRAAIVSGFGPVDADELLGSYRAAGLERATVIERRGWVAALLIPGR
jgi:ribosomal protein L11 methyltransferase